MAKGRVKSDDGELLSRARAGDRVAFSDLVRIHQHEVFTLAVRLVGDRELAADVSQEAFVRAWRALPKFRGDAKFSTWIHRITVNAAWTQRNKQRKHWADPIDEAFTEPATESISPERAAESAAIQERLQEALHGLSDLVRSVVVLKDIYGWSHGEVAEHLDISVAAAKVRLHRGRKQLRTELWAEMKAEQ
ncbi:MAG: sigma-70 family RNA polymerase sigma factor [Actinomycetota bacterium]|nr:sigma-70 family RNA polymerase sigma factor [Actinomycetota bacterium]